MKICDFGYSKSESINSRWQTANVGTPSYLAPELLTLRPGQDYDGRVRGRAPSPAGRPPRRRITRHLWPLL